MNITKLSHLPENKQTCCKKTTERLLISTEAFEIKLFEMQPSGYSPLHSHPAQHQIIVIDGEGTVSNGKNPKPIKIGDAISIQANEPHQFKPASDKPLMFLAVTFGTKI